LWIASSGPGGTSLAQLLDDALVETRLEVPEPYDLVAGGLLWLEGNALKRGTPCRD
jgi:hypothetical protein